MSRVYNPDSAGKERNKLVRSVVLALRELMKQQQADGTTRDLAAFISMALTEINSTIETSVEAWEKRGYWVKADKFRLEWEWTGKLGKIIGEALVHDDWGTIALKSAEIAQKLGKVTIPEHHRLGTPWVGAWKQFNK